MLVIGDVIDDERLDRIEEQPRMVADPLRRRAALVHAAPQFGEDELGTGHVLAAQHGSFELCDQQSACAGRQLPEKLSPADPFRPCRHHTPDCDRFPDTTPGVKTSLDLETLRTNDLAGRNGNFIRYIIGIYGVFTG